MGRNALPLEKTWFAGPDGPFSLGGRHHVFRPEKKLEGFSGFSPVFCSFYSQGLTQQVHIQAVFVYRLNLSIHQVTPSHELGCKRGFRIAVDLLESPPVLFYPL